MELIIGAAPADTTIHSVRGGGRPLCIHTPPRFRFRWAREPSMALGASIQHSARLCRSYGLGTDHFNDTTSMETAPCQAEESGVTKVKTDQ